MPGFQDSAFLIVLALLLFGPKKLPQLARQAGKLMADFRRASNEFRTQMEEELRISEQADRQKKVAAIETAAPAAAALNHRFSEISIRFWKLIFKTKKATRLYRAAFLLNCERVSCSADAGSKTECQAPWPRAPSWKVQAQTLTSGRHCPNR